MLNHNSMVSLLSKVRLPLAISAISLGFLVATQGLVASERHVTRGGESRHETTGDERHVTDDGELRHETQSDKARHEVDDGEKRREVSDGEKRHTTD